MTLAELEKNIEMMRSRPLILLCRAPGGEERKMSVKDCIASGSTYIHVVADELDSLLACELGQQRSGGIIHEESCIYAGGIKKNRTRAHFGTREPDH